MKRNLEDNPEDVQPKRTQALLVREYDSAHQYFLKICKYCNCEHTEPGPVVGGICVKCKELLVNDYIPRQPMEVFCLRGKPLNVLNHPGCPIGPVGPTGINWQDN